MNYKGYIIKAETRETVFSEYTVNEDGDVEDLIQELDSSGFEIQLYTVYKDGVLEYEFDSFEKVKSVIDEKVDNA